MRLVSIIVPVYNREKEVCKCYNSIIRQTYNNIEIIFVNDGSTDNTNQVLESFSDNRVKIFNTINNGPSEASRFGFNNSCGEYILFIDSDDTIESDYVYKLVYSLEKNKCNMAIGRVGIHYYYPMVREVTLRARIKPRVIDLLKNKKYLPALSPTMTGKLFKRELLEFKNINFMANEDIVVMYPLYIKSRYICVVNNAVYHYYLSSNSQFNKYLIGYSFDIMFNTFEPLRYIYDDMVENNLLNKYYYEIEMLFIKNISERIWNIIECVDDKIYRYKFISVILDYLEYFFPNWDRNKYYLNGFVLGEVNDIFHLMKMNSIISSFSRKKINIKLEDIYNKYKNIEVMYNKSINKKDYISRI